MPRGIFLIVWEEYTGGEIAFKYPVDLVIPMNSVQQLQISHNFIDSFHLIKTKELYSLSYYNAGKQVVSALVLDQYENSEDYKPILTSINSVIEHADTDDEDYMEDLEFQQDIIRVYKMSDEVYKPREQVLLNLASDIVKAKDKNTEYEEFLNFLYKRLMNEEFEHNILLTKIALSIFLKTETTLFELKKDLNCEEETIIETLNLLREEHFLSEVKNEINESVYKLDYF